MMVGHLRDISNTMTRQSEVAIVTQEEDFDEGDIPDFRRARTSRVDRESGESWFQFLEDRKENVHPADQSDSNGRTTTHVKSSTRKVTKFLQDQKKKILRLMR